MLENATEDNEYFNCFRVFRIDKIDLLLVLGSFFYNFAQSFFYIFLYGYQVSSE